MMRRLLSTRRQVPLYELDEYLAGWNRLRAVFTAAGGHAWLFRAAHRHDQFLEFLEYRADPTILEQAEIAAAREALDEAFGVGQLEGWEEAPTKSVEPI
jgi:hypothetical protein